VIYDFKTRRRYAVNTAAREYVEYSLYDTLGFRVMELQNRVRLQAMLAVPMPAMNMAVQENELSLLKGAPGAVDEKTVDGTRSYSIGGIQLATWSEAGAKVAADDAAQFARFMRYAQGGHPQLLDKLAQGRRDSAAPELCPQRRPHFAARYQRGAHDGAASLRPEDLQARDERQRP
jgi:hypothetical protein